MVITSHLTYPHGNRPPPKFLHNTLLPDTRQQHCSFDTRPQGWKDKSKEIDIAEAKRKLFEVDSDEERERKKREEEEEQAAQAAAESSSAVEADKQKAKVVVKGSDSDSEADIAASRKSIVSEDMRKSIKAFSQQIDVEEFEEGEAEAEGFG